MTTARNRKCDATTAILVGCSKQASAPPKNLSLETQQSSSVSFLIRLIPSATHSIWSRCSLDNVPRRWRGFIYPV
ncbi:MAG: hypothetical protein ACI80I_000852 [Akkermansiaceae bacterium]|jgi:hypothetical protein